MVQYRRAERLIGFNYDVHWGSESSGVTSLTHFYLLFAVKNLTTIGVKNAQCIILLYL